MELIIVPLACLLFYLGFKCGHYEGKNEPLMASDEKPKAIKNITVDVAIIVFFTPLFYWGYKQGYSEGQREQRFKVGYESGSLWSHYT